VAGKPGTLPEVLYELSLEVELFQYVIGTEESVEVRPISRGEPLRLNVGPATTLGVVTSISGDTIHLRLSRPVVAREGWRWWV